MMMMMAMMMMIMMMMMTHHDADVDAADDVDVDARLASAGGKFNPLYNEHRHRTTAPKITRSSSDPWACLLVCFAHGH